jgi:hypothetical protein
MLPNDYLVDLEQKARRFSGAFTGTSGYLAGGVINLIKERQNMTAAFDQLEADNQALRDAVEARLGGGILAAEAACCEGGRCHPAGDDEEPTTIDEPEAGIPVDWILRGERELKQEPETVWHDIRQLGDGLTANQEATPAEALLHQAIEVIRDRRPKYGGPLNHFSKTVGMINAAFADVLKRPLTPADWAVIMTLDKVARHMGPAKTLDTPVDLAGYAACLAECEAKP